MKPPIISVNLYDSLRRGAFRFYQRVTPDTYSHTVAAFGGYDTAQMTLATTQAEAEDWLESGLGRHVKVYASALDVIWEGFINQIKVNTAPQTATLGPLLSAQNRVYVMYSPLVEGTQGDVSGGQAITDAANNTESQDRYGILPVVLSAGTVTEADAEYMRDVHLADNAWPKLTKSFASPAGKAVSVTLSCKGYQHFLGYPYTAAAGALVDTSVKITSVLAATPYSAWLSYGTDHIDTSSVNSSPLEDQYRPASTVIKDAVARGDGSARWLFQVLNDREAYYHAAPTDIEYLAYVQDRGTVLVSTSQAAIAPWRMRPGFWLAFGDFMIGRTVPTNASNKDPRLMFVEKVTYRSPLGLQLAGGKTDEILQVMAMYGMGGAT